MERKLGIVFASRATNRVCRLAAALASRYRFYVHLVNEGLVAFRKHALPRLNDTGIAAAPVSALR
jgi:peroxiredoxin family protein